MSQPSLQRRLGLVQATALNMIDMVGIGPFVITAETSSAAAVSAVTLSAARDYDLHEETTITRTLRFSGNRAFDEYRTDTLRRLEEEQREFQDFLGRLRMAKDKAEFDQFMAERRGRPDTAAQPSA